MSFDGGYIWDTGFDFAVQGKHFLQNGKPVTSKQEAREYADKYAKIYGANRYKGCWDRKFGIETPNYDGISYYQCQDCNYTWDRFTGREIENGADQP